MDAYTDTFTWELEGDERVSMGQGRAKPARLMAGTLIVSVAFCTLVFWAGWKEAALIEKCGLQNAVHCSPAAARNAGAGPPANQIGKFRTTSVQSAAP
jgi:hypothetical protein